MDKDVLHSGTHGECSWDIEKDGTLRIYPTNGKEGMLQNGFYFQVSPWVWYSEDIKKVYVEKGVKTNSWANRLFAFLGNCNEIDVRNLDTSKTENMKLMFCRTEVAGKLDLSNFDTSNVTNMSEMFLKGSFAELSLSSFDTSNVTTMRAMFAHCSLSTNLDITHFNTSKVTDMGDMFFKLKNVTELDVSNFDTNNVTCMDYMFFNCASLKTLNLGNGFLESQLSQSKKVFDGVPRDIKLISGNVDAVNLGFENETVRPIVDDKDFKWTPTKPNDDKEKTKNTFNIPIDR